MIPDDAELTPPRWTRLAPLAGCGLLGLGLVLTAVSTLYDDLHWDTVYQVSPAAAAKRNGMTDLTGVLLGRAFLIVSAVTVIGLLVCVMGLARRRRWAHIACAVVAAPYVVCCGVGYASGRSLHSDLANPQYLNPRSSYAPTWLLVCDTAGPALTIGGAAATLMALLLLTVRGRLHRPR
ncbi:hypothetical protein Rhe02_19460 [Rhizocola hellebori]|uniref:Uncharacterized protein n=1 Tax=Rhizocola hellebori TaxID=1392758 RepID=A0A8J3VDU7_9ACTN|nr:hypothetical protein [Rhizocola hellebori]GIH03879.1 hypothetical protein Rhe02_19460 [Rhizocola hellebori]